MNPLCLNGVTDSFGTLPGNVTNTIWRNVGY